MNGLKDVTLNNEQKIHKIANTLNLKSLYWNELSFYSQYSELFFYSQYSAFILNFYFEVLNPRLSLQIYLGMET